MCDPYTRYIIKKRIEVCDEPKYYVTQIVLYCAAENQLLELVTEGFSISGTVVLSTIEAHKVLSRTTK